MDRLDHNLSARCFQEEGYLADKGLIPLPDVQRRAVRDAGASLTLLQM